jgi:DNA mismatch endonuclease, patch repair protein
VIDIVSRTTRSRMMAGIRGRNTKPELVVRRTLRSLGVGYRLHVASLPGRPDIVMFGRRKIIEVRGCFWHRHAGCRFAYTPKSNLTFWRTKFRSNVVRDRQNVKELKASGWQVLTIWECETAAGKVLRQRLRGFINSKNRSGKGRHRLNRPKT